MVNIVNDNNELYHSFISSQWHNNKYKGKYYPVEIEMITP